MINKQTQKNMKTINTINEFENNMKNAMNFIFNNEKAVLSAFNELLINDEELKNEFLSLSDDEKNKNYKALINSIIFDLAIKDIK
jgi:hypothetical protein